MLGGSAAGAEGNMPCGPPAGRGMPARVAPGGAPILLMGLENDPGAAEGRGGGGGCDDAGRGGTGGELRFGAGGGLKAAGVDGTARGKFGAEGRPGGIGRSAPAAGGPAITTGMGAPTEAAAGAGLGPPGARLSRARADSSLDLSKTVVFSSSSSHSLGVAPEAEPGRGGAPRPSVVWPNAGWGCAAWASAVCANAEAGAGAAAAGAGAGGGARPGRGASAAGVARAGPLEPLALGSGGGPTEGGGEAGAPAEGTS